MLKPFDIVAHLQECLPLYTNQFHDELPVTSGLVSSGIFTVVFAEPHGLDVGYEVNFPKTLIRNRITDVIVNGDDTVSYITESEHDLTAFASSGHGNTWPEGLQVNIDVDGTPYTIDLLPDESAIPNPMEFTGVEGSIEFVPGGNDYLLENRSYGVGGVKTVATVPNDTTITIDLSDVPEVPDGPVIMDYGITNPRVTTAVDLERAEEIYTSQRDGKAWLFVIMLDRRPSKSRNNQDDFTSLPGSTLKLLNIMQDFSTLVILPCDKNLAGEEAKDFAYDELFVILNQCIYGWEKTGFNGDGQVNYNTSFYSHAYEWQTRQQIDWTNGYINNKTTDLRELHFTQTVFDEGESSGEIKYP